MKKFLYRILFYVITGLLVFLTTIFVSSKFVERNTFFNWETESNLLIIKENASYDVLIMGISHARNISRHKNHLRFEKITGKNMINIGQGGDLGGLHNQYEYLKYFYQQNNKTNKVLIILSPSLMYENVYDKSTKAFEGEPIRIGFLKEYFLNGSPNKYPQLFSYLTSKLTSKWIKTKPFSLEEKLEKLDSINHAEVKDGFRLTFIQGFNNTIFNQQKTQLENILSLCKKNGSKPIIMIPPALFGKWPGHIKVDSLCNMLEKKQSIKYFDFSESIKQPELYYDHHHLNTNGVILFISKYLKPILK